MVVCIPVEVVHFENLNSYVSEIFQSPPVAGNILLRISRGEYGAMEDCIDQFGGLIWGIVRKYIRGNSDAEDLVQEIFTEIWRVSNRYNSALATEATFIGLIARRRAIDWVRKSSRAPEMQQLDAMVNEIPCPAGIGGESIDAEEVFRTFYTLPDETRKLFELHFQSGLTHHEISSKTGIPLGTVKTKLRRGLVSLRQAMKRVASPFASPLVRHD